MIANPTTEQRQAIERSVIRKLLEVGQAAGWTIREVWDGENNVDCASDQDVMDAVFSVDASLIYCIKDNVPGRDRPLRQSVYIVLGNEGWDCINDHSVTPLFLDEVMEAVNLFTDNLADPEA